MIHGSHPFHGARRRRPTLRHRPAVWENLLGTVYARSPEGEVRYFNFDWDGAREFAGITDDADHDLRLYRAPTSSTTDHIRKGQLVLYAKDAS